MALNYDFDMVSVTPDGLPDQFDDLAFTGVGAEKTAMFRDPKTAEALRNADSAVRMFFLESGFGLQHYDSGAPPGRYPVSDEDHRIRVIERLTANLASHDLTDAKWGGFDFQAFLGGLDQAEPLEDESLLAPISQPPRYDPALVQAASASQKRRRLAFAGLAVGFVLLLYTALEIIL